LDYLKKKRIEDYLIKYKVNRNVEMIIDDQQLLGSRGFDGKVEEFFDLDKLSWKIMSDEYYDFEELLRNKNISFKSSNGIITIDHKGFVSFNNLTQLPENTVFNNKGYVYLYSLTQLPENKEQIFKNDGIVLYNRNKTYDPRIAQ